MDLIPASSRYSCMEMAENGHGFGNMYRVFHDTLMVPSDERPTISGFDFASVRRREGECDFPFLSSLFFSFGFKARRWAHGTGQGSLATFIWFFTCFALYFTSSSYYGGGVAPSVDGARLPFTHTTNRQFRGGEGEMERARGRKSARRRVVELLEAPR